MPINNAQEKRLNLFSHMDRLRRAHRDEIECALYWGHICSASAKLASLLVNADKETSGFLLDLSARAGKRSAGANMAAAAFDNELYMLQRQIFALGLPMTWRELRDEQAQTEGGI